MWHPRLHLVALLAVSLGGVAAFAQVVDGIDVGAARTRARALGKDLDAFTDEIQRRGDALRAQAEQARAGGMANRARLKPTTLRHAPGTNGIDLDQMVADADQMSAEGGKDPRPRLIAFASLSMPPQSLRRMIADVNAAGGIVVFQGFPNNSVKQFMAGLSRSMDLRSNLSAVGVDPRLFRAFDVHSVPQYVVTSSNFELCDGFSCRTATPPSDRISGNVTTGFALETFARGGGPGAAVAKVYLANLHRKGRGE